MGRTEVKVEWPWLRAAPQASVCPPHNGWHVKVPKLLLKVSAPVAQKLRAWPWTR